MSIQMVIKTTEKSFSKFTAESVIRVYGKTFLRAETKNYTLYKDRVEIILYNHVL